MTPDGTAYESCGGSATITSADGAIVDGVTPSIKATVFNRLNSKPLAAELVDTNGDPVAVGGGTQYQQGTAATDTDQLMLAGCVRSDTAAVATGVIAGDRARCIVDATGQLWVHVGVVDGTVSATQSGTWNINSITTLPSIPTGSNTIGGVNLSQYTPITGRLPVDGSGVTQPISGTVNAAQSGTWTVQPGNTANTTPWKVDGSGVTQPVSGTVSSTLRDSNAIERGTFTNPLVTSSYPVGFSRLVPGAYPSNPQYVKQLGLLGQVIDQSQQRQASVDPCMTSKKTDIAISQTATSVAVPASAQTTFVCYVRLIAGAAEIISLWEGTGTNCGTGTIAHSGSTTTANGESVVANGGYSAGSGGFTLATIPPGKDFCIAQNGSNRIAGQVLYVHSP